MGEVYRARDTRLDRIVAIKVLPPHLADKPELRERFEREARAVASLSHPHICTLHDIGHQDGTDFLVLEYLEGETLAERLKKGPLLLEQVLQYAIEIADALDKAHRKGVTHRDLKPGNIMLTKSGTKLLDFGLAKLRQEATPAPNISLSKLPTANDQLTAAGTILGTLQYMAPEQLEGKEVDARTDIFAFGVVLYEITTGKKAFAGQSQASVISAIMSSHPPPMSALQPMTPPALDQVVKRCLAKERDERCQSAKDLTDELKWIAEGGSQPTLAPTAAVQGIRALMRRPLVLSLGTLLLGLLVASLGTWNLKPSPQQRVSRFTITLPAGQQLAGMDVGSAVAVSPDGSYIAYVGRQGNSQQIYLRALDNLQANPIPGTEGAVSPFFSPDGKWVGFFAERMLKKVSVTGGAVLSISAADLPRGATWGSQGMIAFAPGINGVIHQVSEEGGSPQPLTRLGKGEISHRWPEFLPEGKAVIFAASAQTGSWSNSQVWSQSLGTEARRPLVQLGTQPHYANSGHLIYAQAGNLMGVRFDSNRFTVTGAPVPVLESVLQSTTGGSAQYSFSLTGLLVYVPGGIRSRQTKLVWVNRSGREELLTAPARAYLNPRLSPDGRRVAVGIVEQESQVWVYDFSRETLTRVTFEGSANLYPAWTPDGKRLTFQSSKEGSYSMFWELADGSGGLEQLGASDYPTLAMSWTPDGQTLAFMEINPSTGRDIWMMRLIDRKSQPFLRTRFTESAARFSPDGRWLAYVSDESGRFEVYVQAYPGPGGKYQVSTEGGTEPVWNPNGRELFYRSGNKMMAVDVTLQPNFSAGKPKVLFEAPYEPTPATLGNYDVSPDGQRFLMLKPVEQEQAAPTQIVVVQNWFEELKQKVPTGKK